MPPPGNVPLSFNRDRTERQLDTRFEELLAKLRKNRPSEDPWIVRRGYEIATERHRDQWRISGDPYLTHLLEVAHILADMRLDATTLTAALLHDVIEDTEFPLSRIEERFGEDVAHLVEGVTKIGRLNMMAPEARQAENVRKMLLAMVNDVRVVLVKLADRLHNMRTLEFLDPPKQQRISRETLDIYAPIAHRLGMSIIRGELEDLSFRYLEPEAFLALQKEVIEKAPVHRRFLDEVQTTIRSKLVENGIPAELEARVKSLYSLHRKILRQERSLEQVYDLLAIRVITDNERNCYAALGVVHHIWRPVPGRFKDYIAIARPNLYQSLHTTVIHGGQSFEIQIRTQEMHRIAEEGVAAHWKYKDGKPSSGDDDQRITWMRQLIEWSQELQEPGEFLSNLRVDLAQVEVYAFTPKGRVLELPRGATPVDFAYTVHTEVGHQCVGAKVNGHMVSLRHEIVSGDVVEILTQKGHTPSRDWLSFTKSSHARSKIRHWINLQEREEAREMGQRLLEKEARQFGRSLKKIPEADLLKQASDYGLSKIEDLYAAVGFGKYSARQVLARVLGEPAKPPQTETEDSKPTLTKTVKRMLGLGEAPLIVKGHDDLLVYRAKCCNPIPGDDIIGYITRGRGVAVHTRACPNVQNLLYQTERRIAVEWGGVGAATFPVQLLIRAKDRPGLLAEITTVISGAGSNIRILESRPDRLNARIEANLEIADRRQLETILTNIRKISGVYGVDRVYQT
ncbi:MAG TPA: bifunctional (p)ppGpp synthetase/guanosine-3',5'-bis(diphosphate) 3'-pyrophosphohydrolase [Candidatus Acidoferrum sp.]|jgi:GTP pyrophosphokinase|nr:bifunctional (p)ppGpp synthetase/guanosine-3',5'-bis(diphosphate) 3'-pyrophosphohydrolase [Candidatus Acidoferrum sp.]